MSKRLVCGIGINDNEDITIKRGSSTTNGIRTRWVIWECPYYKRWLNMIHRCYGKPLKSYRGCTVCAEWLVFSSFKKWMKTQEWEGLELDKDLLCVGNKIYCPEYCLFVPRIVNAFLMINTRINKTTMVGSHLEKGRGKFTSVMSNPFSKTCINIGRFATELEAHLAWKKKKHEYACLLADSDFVTDVRVRRVLRNRYKNYTIIEEHLS